MKRRAFVIGCAVAAAGACAVQVRAQAPATVHRVGFLTGRPRQDDVVVHLRTALHNLGYSENQNLVIEWRWGDGRFQLVPALLTDLIAAKVAVIAVLGNDAIALAKRDTTIPVVMVGASHPVEMGFVETLSRPGGHVTGVAYNPAEVAGKLLEVLTHAFPKVSRIGVVWNSSVPGITLYQPAMYDTARTLGLHLHWIEVRTTAGAAAAFTEIRRSQADALYIVNDTVVQALQPQILSFLARTRLPAIYTARPWVGAGGLMYYGPSATEQWRRVAYYIDRILKGAHPGELPVEQPRRFELVINAKTAAEHGVTFPPEFLARADEIVQ